MTSSPAAAAASTILGGAHDEDFHAHQAPLSVRIANLLAILLPVVGLIVGCALLWGYGFGWVYLGLLLGMYVFTGLGITIGFHRYFTHKSFETTRPIQYLLAFMGSLALEGTILSWAAGHRCHHQHSDRDHDPHSPHLHGEGFRGFIRGLLHSHFGWLLNPPMPDFKRYVPDLLQDKLVVRMSALFPLWVVLTLLIPAVLGGLLTMSWTGVLLGFIWGGLVRILVVHHITWSVNSICHTWGSRDFRSHDESRNNVIVGILAFGEGWHNNHHAFPSSARHGLKWWQFDISYIIIKMLSWTGLVWDVQVPTRERMAMKAVKPEQAA